MDWLSTLAQETEWPLLAAFALGLLTAISPCPLATNITATAYIAKSMTSPRKVLASGLMYTAGRMASYTALGALIFFGVSKFHVARIFQGHGEKFIGPLMILLGLIMLGVIRLNVPGTSDLTGRLSEKFKDKGMTGAFLLGVIFALAFCPYSGALFFAMLMPMMLRADEGLGLPVVFSLGTGLPVVFFSFVIAFSLHKLGAYFKAIQRVEKTMRVIAGLTFILTGLYYLNIYLNIIPT
jgi:cytochrome c-type biogenesis protein